jgi:hypothetical protein
MHRRSAPLLLLVDVRWVRAKEHNDVHDFLVAERRLGY